MSWPAYPEYKVSDIEWLGDVPSHWLPARLKNVIQSMDSGTSVNAADWPAGPDDIGVLKTSCVSSGWFNADANKTVVEDDISRVTCPVQRDTVIVNRANTPLLVGSAGYVSRRLQNIYLSDKLWQVKFDDALATFVYYWTQTPVYRSQIAAKCVGASSSMQNLSMVDFTNAALALPPLDEQASIVDFLTDRITKIDALIAKQEQLIATLREDRTATITHAVTKGLNLAAPTQDSRVEGLDGIPIGWSVRPFLRCVEGRVDYRGATPKKVEDGVILVTARNVRAGRIDYEISTEFVSAEEYDEIMRRGLPQIDDLLFTMEAPLGNAALVDRTDIALAQRIIKFRPDRKVVLPKFLLYSVMGQWFQSQLVARATGSTALGLKASKLPELRLAVPDLEKQSRIVEFLDERWTKIEELVMKAAQAIDILQEYRSALITDAVTGKIDVREAA